MAYNFAAESFHTKKLCSRLFFREKCIFRPKRSLLVFEPPSGGLGATYAVHLMLIRKLLVNVGLLLVIIELFLALCYDGCERIRIGNRRF